MCAQALLRRKPCMGFLLLLSLGLLAGSTMQPFMGVTIAAGTDYGEIQERPAPVWRCPGLPCTKPNIFNISVAVHFDATPAQILAIENLISAGSEILFDVTDGQAEIGEAFIYNNAFGTDADLRIYPSTSPTWWMANTGSWQVGGSIHASINYVLSETAPGETLAHEFVHLVFDARDEYQTDGGPGGSATCPHPDAVAAGEHYCLMDAGGTGASDGPYSELCWGHADPFDLEDISGGNHDPFNITEQSSTRSNRSCWDQVVWSWPDYFTKPAAAPNPGTGGGVVDPTKFINADATIRVVLVLDESGSMSMESPSRIDRLKVAALDFVSLAENGTELGIVSFSTNANPADGHANVAVAALGNTRTTWTNAINDLSPLGMTNIGDGLARARNMIMTAGGVTANTFIVLMTDGVNNRPQPDPMDHLNDVLDDLLDDGIPVYVTCTGGDDGLSSQCSLIASATGGFYVDSADPGTIPVAFSDFHERISGREAVDSAHGSLAKPTPYPFWVEEGAESVTFAVMLEEGGVGATMVVTDPKGGQYEGKSMPQGLYLRVKEPIPGEWELIVLPQGDRASEYVVRAYTRNQILSLTAAVRHPRVLPGKPIYLYAYPRSIGGGITHPDEPIPAIVRLPNGETDLVLLFDKGPDPDGEGDDLAADGTFTGVYKNTNLQGPYQFLLRADLGGWGTATDRSKFDTDLKSPQFVREVRLSAAVGEQAGPKPLLLNISFVRDKGVVLDWQSVKGGKYIVWYTPTLKDEWRAVSTLEGTGMLIKWIDDGGETGRSPLSAKVRQGYYRVNGSE